MIKVSLNNVSLVLDASTYLVDFLSKNVQQQEFAVAINGHFVPRSEYCEITVCDGDEIDVISPVGGG